MKYEYCIIHISKKGVPTAPPHQKKTAYLLIPEQIHDECIRYLIIVIHILHQ